jgi:hypothetical protein
MPDAGQPFLRAVASGARRRRTGSRGSVLVEFALVSLVLYLLIAASIELGRAVFFAQAAQDAARVAAREFALTPLPATMTFDDALADPNVKAKIYDADLLVIDLDALPPGLPLDQFFATLPIVNRALRPVMIYERVTLGGSDRNLLRFPGALLTSATSPTGLTVGIPQVVARAADGTETIQWVNVVEEVRSDPADPTTGPFSVVSTGPDQGLVALRINVPFQAAALSGFMRGNGGAFDPNIGNAIVANDGGVSEINNAPGGLLDVPTSAPMYAGPFGLGEQLAFGKTVRPFRKLVTAQALFRREVFE